ncbi:MAG: molybdate ABC transporter substrate-binding protein [Deltaproteobacteria bacterium]|nr:molybdate ABC transporter substrate-binding protein [Deltaproteobacteria bacterium]
MIWRIFKTEMRIAVICMMVLYTSLVPATAADETDTVTVFAAASTTNAMSDIGQRYMEQQKGRIRFSFAASSTLAKQIDNGAPADIYVSANVKWMDYLMSKKMILPNTRVDLLGNCIVLIVPSQSALKHIDIKPDFPLASYLGDGRLAMGDPEHVPAGIYGKEALKRLKVWQQVKNKVAGMKDVRAALMMVERGEVSLGLVYSTDAAISTRVRIVGVFPPETHSPIIYPVAIVANHDRPSVERFMAFLESAAARTVFEKYGFRVRE